MEKLEHTGEYICNIQYRADSRFAPRYSVTTSLIGWAQA